MAPCFLYEHLDDNKKDVKRYEDSQMVSMGYFVTLFLFVPVYFINLFYISNKLEKILYIKVLALLLFILELLTTVFILSGNAGIYFFSFLFSVLLAYVLEDQLVYFYIKIIPSDFELIGIKGLTGLHIIAYIGDIVGAGSSIFGLLSKKSTRNFIGENLMTGQNCFAIAVQIVLVVLFFIYTKEFTDKPIRRIGYSRNVRKIRRTEF